MNSLYIKRLTAVSLFAVLIVIASFISVPFGTVPLTLQTFMIVLIALILGPVYATLTILLYIMLIIIGLPVASGGVGGLQVMMGPTGGFIIGFILTAIIAGTGSKIIGKDTIQSNLILGILSIIAILSVYIIGLPWFAIVAQISIMEAAISMSIFYFFDIIKAIFATITYISIRKRIDISEYVV